MRRKKEHVAILKLLSQLRDFTSDNVFNPYRDICSIHDTEGAPNLRLSNLERYLTASLSLGIDAIWVGRDLGYRGGRRTGLALTDEFHLDLAAKSLNTDSFYKSTKTICVKERTASEVWSLINLLDKPPFLWNIFPFHPHEKNDSMSNRCHTKKEFHQASFFSRVDENLQIQ
ncbi:uracil-DNA glycosylase [Klebsiella quasipneumoniae]